MRMRFRRGRWVQDTIERTELVLRAVHVDRFYWLINVLNKETGKRTREESKPIYKTHSAAKTALEEHKLKAAHAEVVREKLEAKAQAGADEEVDRLAGTEKAFEDAQRKARRAFVQRRNGIYRQALTAQRKLLGLK